MSILSYPDRGPWGKASWRGNCSGRVYKDLFERLRPRLFVDPMVGSGTSIEVAKEMKIDCVGLDLHQGFNAVRDSILEAVGKPADLCISHPPYGGCIRYSGEVWGDAPHPDDLSWCADDDEFNYKMQLVLLNQREACRSGGIFGAIIGDWRRQGKYSSYQAEMIARMPADELRAVLIKEQHNCQSDRKAYGNMRFPFVTHEYVLLWEKKAAPLLVLLGSLARQQYDRLTGTWKAVVKLALMSVGGKADLGTLYDIIAKGAPEKLATNNNWREKIRQTLNQNSSLFKPVDRGVWSLA